MVFVLLSVLPTLVWEIVLVVVCLFVGNKQMLYSSDSLSLSLSLSLFLFLFLSLSH